MKVLLSTTAALGLCALSVIAGVATGASQQDNCAPNSPPSSAGVVSYRGVNIAGFDVGCYSDGTCIPSAVYTPLLQYNGPDGAGQMEHFVNDRGYNLFRLPVGWQFLTNNVRGGTLDATNFPIYDALVQACLNTGASCIIDIHNYGRWDGQIIGQGGPTNEQFAALWSSLATKYAAEEKIIFGIMNEPHEIPDITIWAETVQAAVTAIRMAGAETQLILLPGNNYSSGGALISSGSGAALSQVKNLDGTTTGLIFDIHLYLDSDRSGMHAECVTDSISEALAPLVQWLRRNGRQALNTEMGGGNTASCVQYVCQMVAFENANSDVILGYSGWAAGGFSIYNVLTETPVYVNGTWTDTLLVSSCLAPVLG